MVYKIKMKKDDYFKVNNKIISTNLEISGDEVTFEIEGGSYHILKRTNYDFKLIESLQSKLFRFFSRYGLLITGILFLLSVLYMNIYRVSEIRFNRKTPINDEIEYRIKSSFRRLFCFDFCNLNYDDFSLEMQKKYYEYPYISVKRKNNIIDVYIANVDEMEYSVNESQVGNIIAKKDSIVDSFYVYSGKAVTKKNRFVKEGDILIEGNNKAGGLVLGTTYDKVELEVFKTEKEFVLGEESDEYFDVKLFGWSFSLGKDSNYSYYDSASNMVFNLFDFFSVKKIAETKKDAIIKKYSYEEAYHQAVSRIEEDFLSHQTNELEHIVAITKTKEAESDNSYIFTFIIKKYESIGTFVAKE